MMCCCPHCRPFPACRRWLVAVAGGLLAAGLLTPAVGRGEPTQTVAEAIAQLASDQFADREAASSRLAAAGADAIAALVAAARGDDPEVAVRAVDILRGMLGRGDAALAEAAEAGLQQVATAGSLAIAQQAETALDFYGRAQEASARRVLEQLGATFTDAGLRGVRIEIAANWQGDSSGLRLITRLRNLMHISLYGLTLNDRDAATLGQLRTVQRIDLFGVEVSPENLAQLQRWLPEVEIDVRKGGKLGIAGMPLQGQCIVSGVQVGSAAEKAGLQPQDVIVEIDGQPVPNFDVCTEMIGGHGPGEEISLLIERRGPDGRPARFRREVILGGWSRQPDPQSPLQEEGKDANDE